MPSSIVIFCDNVIEFQLLISFESVNHHLQCLLFPFNTVLRLKLPIGFLYAIINIFFWMVKKKKKLINGYARVYWLYMEDPLSQLVTKKTDVKSLFMLIFSSNSQGLQHLALMVYMILDLSNLLRRICQTWLVHIWKVHTTNN